MAVNPDWVSAPGAVPEKKPRKKSIKGIAAKKIAAVHNLAARLTGEPGLALEADEAEELAAAIEDFLKEYNVEVSGKSAALFGLIITLMVIEGPRIALLAGRRKRRVKPAVREEGGKNNVFTIPGTTADVN